MGIATTDPQFRAELITAQTAHLARLETFGKSPALQVEGVPIMLAWTYDLIQICNHAFLKARLEGTPS
jgi:hypothetical protein